MILDQGIPCDAHPTAMAVEMKGSAALMNQKSPNRPFGPSPNRPENIPTDERLIGNKAQRLYKLSLQRRKIHRRRRMIGSRRRFMIQGTAMAISGTAIMQGLSRKSPIHLECDGAPLRPPTADENDTTFQSRCIRCGLCGTVCENGCIRFFGLDEHSHGAMTPYLDPRRRSCTLCMRCTQVCPTEALTAVPDNLDRIAGGEFPQLKMGMAVVERDTCLSYLGRICGYCHDACPIPDVAIKLTPPALPVILDGCVGCGRCVEFCPQSPTAISIIPKSLNQVRDALSVPTIEEEQGELGS